MRRKDGTYAVVADRAYIERDTEGRAVRVIGALADITQRKQAEEHYRQVDRLEAVGRLAGGIAHDLNNMLQSILGWAEMLSRRFDGDSPEAREVSRIREPATRAAALTQQLLAYARRDLVQPRPVDVNAAVTEAVALLRPLLGSKIHLDLRLAPHLSSVLADKSRLEQAVVNLGLNARDAMPNGGRLAIETASATLDAFYIERHGGIAIRPGPLRHAGRERHRARDGPRNPRPDFRAVLHDQARRPRHRTRTRQRVWHGQTGGRAGVGLQRARSRHGAQAVPTGGVEQRIRPSALLPTSGPSKTPRLRLVYSPRRRSQA
jgi:phospho-acceptor domain-containing protein